MVHFKKNKKRKDNMASKKKRHQRAEELLVSQWPSISSSQLCLWMSSCSWVTFLGTWWQDLYSGHRKILNSTKPTNAKKAENPLCGSTSCAAAHRRAAHRMTRLGQSLRDPHSLMIGEKPRSKPPGSHCGVVWPSGAEVSSIRRRSPLVNLRRSLQEGA